MKKFAKRELSERENMVALAGMTCFCGCRCSGVCSCPPIPTHQIQYDQESQGITQSATGASDSQTIYFYGG